MKLNQDFSQLTTQETYASLESSENGLTTAQAVGRAADVGKNDIPRGRRKSPIQMFLRQFRSLLVIVLFVASLVSWLMGHLADAYIILVVVAIDAVIGFIQEWRAERSVAALDDLVTPTTKAIRDGNQQIIAASDLVPGDMIALEAGDAVPADARLIKGRNLRTVESSFSGESLPVSKTEATLAGVVSLVDRKNMLWRGTFVSTGSALAMVTATGKSTALGKIAMNLSDIGLRPSHFQQKINRLASQMAIFSIGAAVLLFVVGYFTLDIPTEELLLISVAAMVSAIPEGLSSIIAIVLAIGSRRMSRRNAIIREFTATETLGAVTTIITDKTGTLTENALTVKRLQLPDGKLIEISGDGWNPIGSFALRGQLIEPAEYPDVMRLIRIAALCNNARLSHDQQKNIYELSGDPTEGALLVVGKKAGFKPSSQTRLDDLPFNSTLRLRASVVMAGEKRELLVVGAPEVILGRCAHLLVSTLVTSIDEPVRKHILDTINSMSSQSLRVIALAYKDFDGNKIDESDLTGLVLSGLVGMMDPPRKGVGEAVMACREAGIRVIMATGDHVSTAVAIARTVRILDEKHGEALTGEQLNLLDDEEFDEAIRKVNVFARLNPDTKLRIATRLQELGELIAMTGDGVNDSPALKKADVGIAMGVMGTDIAKDSAKVILADDNFSTIVHAIEEGRVVFMNARQATFYLITTNFAEITTMIIAVSLGLPIPLTAVQILWLNLVTDGIGDMALAAERGHGEVLKAKPLGRDERILHSSIVPFLLINVLVMTSLTIMVYLRFLPEGVEKARTAAFIVMSFTQLFNLYNMRSISASVFSIGIFTNPFVTLTMVSSALLTVGIIEIPTLQRVFGFQRVPPLQFAVMVALSSLVLWVGEIYKGLRTKRMRNQTHSAA